MSHPVYPVFLRLEGRKVVLVGGGRVAAQKLPALLAAGAAVTVVAPAILPGITGVTRVERAFRPEDLDGARWVVAAAPPAVNAEVAQAAEARGLFVNAADDPARASAFLGGVVRRGDVTVAVSTGGAAPALAALIKESLDALLPPDLGRWVALAQRVRQAHKAAGVPMEERKALLARELRSARGFVSLVGAGPGDPDLLTRRALQRLADADVVFHDALVPAELVELAPRARRYFVGKRAGRPSIAQETISRLLVRAARRGQRVVRLKCGDPFVLGRGGEEALALVEAGVPFEVVPGVSSAISAPALSGIPVTHRGLASGFVVVAGHAPASYGPILDGLEAGARSLTLVVLMGIGQRAAIADRLIGRGWSAQTPAAITWGAGTPGAHTWVGTLSGLGAAEVPPGELPGTLVIGTVASLACTLGQSDLPQVRVSNPPLPPPERSRDVGLG